MLAAADGQDHPAVGEEQPPPAQDPHRGGDLLEDRLPGVKRLAIALRGPARVLEIRHVLEETADGNRLPAVDDHVNFEAAKGEEVFSP